MHFIFQNRHFLHTTYYTLGVYECTSKYTRKVAEVFTLQTNCPCFAFDLNQIGKSFLTKLSSQKFHKCFGSLQLS